MTAVRPPVWPTVQPPASGGAGAARSAAQRAFFQTALAQTGAPQPQPQRAQTPTLRAETPVQPAAQRVRSEFVQPAEQPQKILRPGSLLDIKV